MQDTCSSRPLPTCPMTKGASPPTKGSAPTKTLMVVIARVFHLFPFRTEKLSPSAPMVLPKGGRVGRRHNHITRNKAPTNTNVGAFAVLSPKGNPFERTAPHKTINDHLGPTQNILPKIVIGKESLMVALRKIKSLWFENEVFTESLAGLPCICGCKKILQWRRSISGDVCDCFLSHFQPYTAKNS